MATITFGAVAGNWSDATKWVGGVRPTAADDVLLNATSASVVIDSTTLCVCRSMDDLGYTGTMSGTGTLIIGDGSGGACRLASGATYSGSWGVNFVSTSNNGGTGWSVTNNGKAFPGAVTFNGTGGKWVQADAFSCGSATLTVTAGGFFGNGKTITCGVFSSSNSNTRTVDITNCSVTCSASSGWDTGTNTNLTLTATGSTITCSGSSATFRPGGTQAYNAVSCSAVSGAGIYAGQTTTVTVVNFTVTGTATKTATFSFGAALTITGTLTLGGGSTIGNNRLLVHSGTVGTQRTITCTGASVVINGDVDFKDIAISGSPSWTNAGSAWVGDCGGNGSLITTNRTTPATQTATGTASFTWSTHGWTSRVPLPQDDVLIPNAFVAGRTITVDMPRLGASISRAGGSGSVILANTVNIESYGSLTLVSGDTTSGSNAWTLAGRSSYTITSAGVTFTALMLLNAPNGTYTLQDAFSDSRAAVALNVTNGTLVDNGQSVSISSSSGQFQMTGGTLTKTGAWSFATTTAVLFVSANGGTVTDTGSITLTATSANTRTFAGGGKSYGTLTYTVAGSTGQLTVTGSNTFAAINFSDTTNARTLAFTAGTTTTISTENGFNVQGTAGKLMSVISTTAGTPAYLRTVSVGPLGNQITWNGSGLVFNADNVQLPGTSGNYGSVPDSAALSITGDIDIRVKVALDDFTPTTAQALIAKSDSGTQRSYRFAVNLTSGTLNFLWYTDGTTGTQNSVSSSVAPAAVDGQKIWLRVTLDVDDGVGHYVVKFYTATVVNPSPSDWTQLGTTTTGGSITSIFDSTMPLEIASRTNGTTDLAAGKFYNVQIRNNILDDGTGIVLNWTAPQGLQQEVNYVSVQDIAAGQYASGTFKDYNGINVSGNTGWHFYVDPVGKSIDLRWSVRTVISDQSDLRWSVRATLADQTDLRWAVRTTLSDQSDLRWAVRSLASDSSDLRWRVAANATTSLDLRWRVASLVADTCDLRWRVGQRVGASSDVRWSVRNLGGDSTSLLWSIRSSVMDEARLQWDVRSLCNNSADLRWSVRSLVGNTSNVQWSVRTLVSNLILLQWAVRQAVFQTATLRWRVAAAIAASIGLQWGTRATVADLVTLRWQVREQAGDLVALQWNVRRNAFDTVDLRWNTRKLASDSIVLLWKVERQLDPLVGPLYFAIVLDEQYRSTVQEEVNASVVDEILPADV